MHTILLIWQNSKYYNTPSRLVVLIREICNAIIEQAREYVSGAQIFQLLEEKPIDASKKLQTTIDVCTKFKDAYFEYKGLAENQWQLTTNALFVRLDNFLERCHDILDLTKTITQFNKLDNIFIGGTKGKTLTETVSAIYDKF
jgi:dynein heavy chain